MQPRYENIIMDNLLGCYRQYVMMYCLWTNWRNQIDKILCRKTRAAGIQKPLYYMLKFIFWNFRNVLLVNSSADHLKVGDFGLSKLITVQSSHDVYKMTGETGSCEYSQSFFLSVSSHSCAKLNLISFFSGIKKKRPLHGSWSFQTSEIW